MARLLVGGLVLFIILGVLGTFMKGKQKEALAEADQLYKSGKVAEAIKKYESGYYAADKVRQPEILKLIVEFYAGSGNLDEARKWVKKGVDANVDVTYQGPAVQLLAEAKDERAAREQEREAKRKEQEEKRRGIPITAVRLRQEYTSSPATADERYKGKKVCITGAVAEYIGDSAIDRQANFVTLVLQPNARPWIWCRFGLNDHDRLNQLRPGEEVTVSGTCDGEIVGEIRIMYCSLEKANSPAPVVQAPPKTAPKPIKKADDEAASVDREHDAQEKAELAAIAKAERERQAKAQAEAKAKAKAKEEEETAARQLRFAKDLAKEGRRDQARDAYRRVVVRFPKTKAADEARELLGER